MSCLNVDLSEEHVYMILEALEVYRDHLYREGMGIKGDPQEYKDEVIDNIIVALGGKLPD